MIIKNGRVLNENFEFIETDLTFEDTITHLGKTEEDGIDGTGLYVIPGFIDVHSHGCHGIDGCDGDLQGYEKMSEGYAKGGTTSFLMTTMTLPAKELDQILEAVATFIESGKGASNCRGIYLEGPFFNIIKKGAQYGEYMVLPDTLLMDRFLQQSRNHIKIIAFAPEISMCQQFIQKYSGRYALSMAHTNANYEEAKAAFSAGVASVTHLFNAMPTYHHREPGVIGAAFDSDVFMEIISDGIHIHPAVLRNTFQLAGKNRMVLVSDSIRATGLADGVYNLGGQDVTVTGSTCVLKSGDLAGSATNLFTCVKRAISFGIPKEVAIQAASLNPARLAKIDDVTGSIAIGKDADLLVVDEEFHLVKVFVKGKEVIR